MARWAASPCIARSWASCRRQSTANLGCVTAGAIGGINPATVIFSTSGGGGYWVTDALGTVFTFGDSPNDGDMSATHLNGPIISASGS